MLGSTSGFSTVVGTGSLYSGIGGSGTFTSLSTDPRLNNAGIVSWHSLINNGAKGEGIFVYDSGITEISHGTFTSGQFFAYDNHTSINSGGAGSGTLTGGRVAFMGQQNDGTLGLYKASNGSAAQTIVNSTSTFGSFDNYFTWQICSFGTTAFTGTKNGVSGVYTGIAGGSSAIIANTSTPVPGGGGSFTGFNGASINDSNRVAFVGNFTSGTGIYTRLVPTETSPTQFVSASGSGFNFLGGPVINNAGSICFQAQNTSTGTFALYNGANFSTDAVLVKGASLLGSTVSSIGGYSMNDNGQIAMQVTLANGTQAIVLATPSIPSSTGFSDSITTTQNLQRDLGFIVSSTRGKAQIIGDPSNTSNGVIDYVDYEGSSVSSIKKVSANQASVHIDLDYRFLSAGSFDILLNNVTLQTITAGASGSYTHLSNNYTLASFGLSPGDMDLALRLDTGSGTRELLIDNFNFSVPEPAHLTLLLTACTALLRRRARLRA
jgi:hypothetical protein